MMPAMMAAMESSPVITGRRMQSSEMFILAAPRLLDARDALRLRRADEAADKGFDGERPVHHGAADAEFGVVQSGRAPPTGRSSRAAAAHCAPPPASRR